MSKKHYSQILKEIGEENHKAIKEWFYKNPFLNASDCAADLGLSLPTISKNVKILKAEARSKRG